MYLALFIAFDQIRNLGHVFDDVNLLSVVSVRLIGVVVESMCGRERWSNCLGWTKRYTPCCPDSEGKELLLDLIPESPGFECTTVFWFDPILQEPQGPLLPTPRTLDSNISTIPHADQAKTDAP